MKKERYVKNLFKYENDDTISNLKSDQNLFRIFKRNRISQLQVFKRTQKRRLQWSGKVYLKGCAAGKQPLGSIYLNSHCDNGAVVCRLWRSFSSFVGNCWFSNCDSLIPGGCGTRRWGCRRPAATLWTSHP